jgi:hypothetical protein
MAKQKGSVKQPELNRYGFPTNVPTRRGTAFFEMLAPINGSAIYKGSNEKGEEFHATIPHPDGWEKQLRYLARGG